MIRLKNICKSYDGKVVLRDVTMTLQEGKTHVLVAPSGAGKTTLLRILLGLVEPDEGTIEGLTGKRIGVVFQEDRLVEDLSALSNIRLVNRNLTRERVTEELALMGLEGVENQPVREFSGGMKRRVALLRALLSDTDILLLDEPFKGLDEKTKDGVMERTKALCRGKSVLLITHDQQETAAMAEEVFLHPKGFES